MVGGYRALRIVWTGGKGCLAAAKGRVIIRPTVAVGYLYSQWV